MEPTVNCTRIDLPFITTSKREVHSVKECYLDLYDNHISYKVVADYTHDDEDTGLSVRFECNYRWTRVKSRLADVNMYKSRTEDMYSVAIEFDGVDGDVGWYFNTPKEALVIYNQLTQYLIS